jgi:hypothetical protein
MGTKTAMMTLRIEPDTHKQLLVEAHQMGSSMSKVILNATYESLIEYNLDVAKVYSQMSKELPEGEEKDRITALCDNAIRRAHFWKSKHVAVDTMAEVYKEIEALEGYRDALALEVSERPALV